MDPFLRSVPGSEAHNFFWGPEMGALGGRQKVYVEDVFSGELKHHTSTKARLLI